MNVLVIGSGGREHALVWKLKQSPKVKNIFCAPGNGGIEKDAKCVDIKIDDIQGLRDFAQKNNIGLTVVGPEIPLVAGIVDSFEEKGLKIFGPSKQAAQLEGSKVFSKEFMKKYDIPTASFQSFDDAEKAKAFLEDKVFPLVVKADGLAAGKGVMICQNKEEAEQALDEIMLEKVFSEAGNRVIIEDCLVGEEASILAISDGHQFVVLDSSQDHKRIFDEDIGPNTGGMGAYSPTPVITKEKLVDIALNVIGPTIQGMKEEGAPFKGVLYAGMMMTQDGPMVLEFNVRFGDPETQAILPRLKTDLLDVFLSACNGSLHEIRLEWDKGTCVCVVMSSRGYPGVYEKGKVIKGLSDVQECADTIVFHAGTKKQNDQIVTCAGRVLGVTSLGNDIEQAIVKVYNAVEKIQFEGCFFRRDIGEKALKRKEELSEKRIY
ncbi:MAG: phosphoribosylamine--glycine ligase [Candidatus Omnitrophica bacterium]|nr:phosphoribosylamine--glycine ligase [Candidatus Omnitrophota bacterium]